MLRNTSVLPAIADGQAAFDRAFPSRTRAPGRTVGLSGPCNRGDAQLPARVEILPRGAVERRSMTGRGIRVELVQATCRHRIEFRYRGTSHLILAYEDGIGCRGETFVGGMPQSRSTPRDPTRKLTFLPAGYDFLEWRELQAPVRLLCVYLDPAELQGQAGPRSSSPPLDPRLFFEDAALWSTLDKLKGLVVGTGRESLPYFEALGAVLAHELLRLSGHARPGEATAKGGLAAWQRRLVAAHIEEHLSEQISLASLARLVRLSPYHFSRAFKQSFGMPPHRYHTSRRVERAKILLQSHVLSVTEIGLSLGFNEASSFTTTFRKVAGVTPSRYQRNIAHLPAQNSGGQRGEFAPPFDSDRPSPSQQ